MDYLGHIISIERVSADLTKIGAMHQWPKPKTLKALNGFLGHTGCYKKFVRNYGDVAKPLTNMLNKNQFHWNEEALKAFDHSEGSHMRQSSSILSRLFQAFHFGN